MLESCSYNSHIYKREQYGCIVSKLLVGPEWTGEFRPRLMGQLCSLWFPLSYPSSKPQSSSRAICGISKHILRMGPQGLSTFFFILTSNYLLPRKKAHIQTRVLQTVKSGSSHTAPESKCLFSARECIPIFFKF